VRRSYCSSFAHYQDCGGHLLRKWS
jgi:hypothetical protein